MIIPALDLIDGQVVRLYQGDYGQVTEYQCSDWRGRSSFRRCEGAIICWS